LEPPGLDVGDSASEEVDHAMALGILAREHDALFEVDCAIGRILDGSYGICEKTGKPIPESRLLIVPWTRYSKEALEQLERQHMTRHLPWSSYAWMVPT
jgi:RNA polymerase-binding transcription factor DksA